MKLILLLIISQVYSLALPALPRYKTQALQMFFGSDQEFKMLTTPFVMHRYEKARWNYVERNYQAPVDKDDVPTPFKREKDHKGNLIRTKVMHKSTNGFFVQATNLNLPTDNTGNGFIPIVLGFVFGMQQNKRLPGICYETIELNLILIDEALGLVYKFTNPLTWTNLALIYNDFIHVNTAISANCNFEKIVTTLGGFFSLEGILEFIASNIFSGLDYIFVVLDFLSADTDFYKAAGVGTIVSIIWNFKLEQGNQ